MRKLLLALAALLLPAFAHAENYSDMWFNPGESGWGVTIADHETQLFAVWYTYDTDGSPLWFAFQDLELLAGERIWDVDLALGRIEGNASLSPGERIAVSWSREDGLTFTCSVSPAADGAFGLAVPAGTIRLSRQGAGEDPLLREVEVLAGAVLRVDLP